MIPNWMKVIVPAMLLTASQARAQCHMQYSISLYNDAEVSDDLSTVYGSSSYIDNSTLCGCTHSNYQDALTVTAPDGTYVSNVQSSTAASLEMATTAGIGTYYASSTAYLYCGCAQSEVQAGGQPAPVKVTPFVQVTSVTPPPTLYLPSQPPGQPDTGSATVQVRAVGLGFAGVTPPTAAVALAGASTAPPGITISVAFSSPADGMLIIPSSPGDSTFNVTLTGYPQGVTSGTVTVGGSILGVSPSPWVVKDPVQGNDLATFQVSHK